MATKNNGLRQVTVQIPESNYPFFLKLITHLKFVKKIEEVEKPPTKKQVLESIVEGIREVKRHQKSEIKLKTAKQLLNEL